MTDERIASLSPSAASMFETTWGSVATIWNGAATWRPVAGSTGASGAANPIRLTASTMARRPAPSGIHGERMTRPLATWSLTRKNRMSATRMIGPATAPTKTPARYASPPMATT